MKKFSECYPRFTRANLEKYLMEMQIACPMSEEKTLDALCLLESKVKISDTITKKELRNEFERMRRDAPIMKLGEHEWEVYKARKEVIASVIS